ncbi:hypothetical protein BC792_101246 [Sphingobacterium allocomposti]|jgi:hypothetical protein|uniref:PH (Pleckstrin Homology) domain-containing protein n=1 Tax=Sphingobacterium allocomposti TaxID=415956 RepID=A0A5S5DT85_9SPHI|nr:hypothetical protein [Sphingobacterium composti Yoo et al. 2007 non Ten et al. 2007]TYP98588.1 hypothetical protein BC792_101246 [Sphingobacterium composti Yoo et al. 2007 non Ten et al. 2007]HLS95416.1 hypothetical protein [Sphingobacterium sp.]
MGGHYLFQEKQYLGRDATWISVRMILVLFCFIAYYLNLENLASSQLFFIVGVSVIVVSIIMIYMVHYKTVVDGKFLILSGLWSSKLVKIDLYNIVKIELKPYSTFVFNNPVYNLHKNGKIRFYSGGKDAVWLTDKEGLTYIIGSHKAEELARAVMEAKRKLASKD